MKKFRIQNAREGPGREAFGGRSQSPPFVAPSFWLLVSGFWLLTLVSCASRPDLVWTENDQQCGLASWYDDHGQRTANGEIFNQNALTAAHPSVALNSVVEVTNLRNGRKVVVRINDRLPPIHDGRVIDLSKAAFQKLDSLNTGLIDVELLVVRYGNNKYVKMNRAAPTGGMYLSKPKPSSNSSISGASSPIGKTDKAL